MSNYSVTFETLDNNNKCSSYFPFIGNEFEKSEERYGFFDRL